MAEKKTNAVRLVEDQGFACELRRYEVDENDLSAENVAAKVNLPLHQVFKTLVARGDRTGVLVVCVPGDRELDLRKIAAASGNKRVELVPLKDLQPLTGYLRGGCSPLGMKKAYPTFLDASAFDHPRIAVSAGLRGLQMLLAPQDLQAAAKARTADLCISPKGTPQG